MVENMVPNIELKTLQLGPGQRIVDPAEIAAMIACDPGLGEAIAVSERAAGAPTEVRIIAHQALRDEMRSRRIIESNRRAIEYGRRAKEGKGPLSKLKQI